MGGGLMGFFGRKLGADLHSDLAVEVALALNVRGIATMPVSRDKVPIIPEWPQVCTADPRQTFGHIAKGKADSNFAVVTGKAKSGLFIIDWDGERGERSRDELQEALGELPPSIRVKSGRAGYGWHDWFGFAPDQPEVRTCGNVLAKGVDLRGRGGQAVLPASRHKSGARYRWERAPDEYPLAILPQSWIAALPVAREKGAYVGSGKSGWAPPAEGSRQLIFGDGPDGDGFKEPINSLCVRYFLADPDAEMGPLIERLLELVSEAEVSPSRSNYQRYLDPNYLESVALDALDFAVNLPTNSEVLDGMADELRATLAGSKSHG